MEGLKLLLGFKNRRTEEKYKAFNLKKKKGILRIQRGAVGLFSFLGLFHMIYLIPTKKEYPKATEAYMVVSSLGLLFSILIGMKNETCIRLRQNEEMIFLTNLLINFILIEPNFFLIDEARNLSKGKYFWLGFRISSINLLTLLCYDSFLYKILQTSTTIFYLMIRMRADTSLHNVLVDSGICILICIFFYIKVKGERMTFQELSKVSLQKESLKEFLQFIPEGAAIFKMDHNCLFMNESLKKIFGTSNEDEIKRNILNLKKRDCENWRSSDLSSDLHRENNLKNQFLKIFDGISRGHRHLRARKETDEISEKENKEYRSDDNMREIFYAHHNGNYLDIKFTPFSFEETEAILVLITDITFSIRSHMLSIEENKNYRDMLFSSFSHEIRTPLNCILLLLGKARRKKHSLSEKFLKKYINPSYQSGQILLHLVNNILDYSFLTRGDFRLKISELDIKTECLEVMEVIATQAEIKGVQLFLKLGKNLSNTIKTDSARLKQILCHLLLNAIKFTYYGKITLKVASSKENADGVVFSVKDTGIGMTDDVQTRLQQKLKVSLFSSFQGTENSFGRKTFFKKPKMTVYSPFKITEQSAGASLKLLFCQNLANVLGFQGDDGLKFRSSPQRGSQFCFTVKNHIEDDEPGRSKDNLITTQSQEIIEEVTEFGIRVIWVEGESSSKDLSYSNNFSSSSKEQKILPKRGSRHNTSLFKYSSKHNERKSIDKDEDLDELDGEYNVAKGRLALPIFETNNNQITCEFSEVETNKPCLHSKILVVDDDEFNILAVKSILKQKMLPISSMPNGREAIEFLHREVSIRKNCCLMVQLILMDLNMPVMGGLEATKNLKQEMKDGKLPWTPIIGCTAFTGSGDENSCLESGMDGYETKPLNERKLKSLVERWIKK